jgi:oligosaccharide repeat unit polymerase
MKRVIVGLGTIVAASIAGMAVTLVSSSDDKFWLTMLWAAWALTVSWSFTRPTFSLPLASVNAAMLVFVIMPATGAVLSGQTVITVHNYSRGTVEALRIATLGQFALLGGAIAARTFWPDQRFVRLRRELSASRLDRASLAAVVAGVIGVLLFATVAKANLRDFLAFTSSSGYGAFASSGAGTKIGYFIAFQLVPGVALVLIALRFTSASPRGRIVAVGLGVVSIFILLGGGQRGRLFVPLLAAGLVWFKTTRRRIGPRRLAVFGVLVMLLISAVVAVGRGSAGSRSLTTKNLVTAQFGSGSDLFAPLAGLAETVPSRLPYLNGSSYLETFVFPVPRALWHAKPEGEISRVTVVFAAGDASGLAFPEIGEMYANFGLIGVVFGSFLLGLLVEWLWIRLAQSISLRETVLISVCFAVLLQIFVRGAIAPMLVTFGGLLAATLLVCRRGSGTLSAQPIHTAVAPPHVHPAMAR